MVSNTLNLSRHNFPLHEKDQEYITMVYGGGVNYHRGLQTAIQALRLIPKKIPNIRFLIIGGGTYLSDLKELTRDLGVEEYVDFLGWKQQQELLELMSQADVAIIPHIKSEHTDSTIPHKLFQYMYAGIPILASDCLPLKRILDETGTGVCFKDRDEKSFTESLIQLVVNREFQERNPENGRNWVVNKYNWKKDSLVLTDLYKNFAYD